MISGLLILPPSSMKMINKKILLIFALFLVIVLFTVILTRRGHFYEVELFKSEQGWGYEILKNNKPYIHQPYMPVIEGEVPFSTRQSARKTGRLVVRKIQNHESPAITRAELESIIGK
jgi:hypothetical protein